MGSWPDDRGPKERRKATSSEEDVATVAAERPPVPRIPVDDPPEDITADRPAAELPQTDSGVNTPRLPSSNPGLSQGATIRGLDDDDLAETEVRRFSPPPKEPSPTSSAGELPTLPGRRRGGAGAATRTYDEDDDDDEVTRRGDASQVELASQLEGSVTADRQVLLHGAITAIGKPPAITLADDDDEETDGRTDRLSPFDIAALADGVPPSLGESPRQNETAVMANAPVKLAVPPPSESALQVAAPTGLAGDRGSLRLPTSNPPPFDSAPATFDSHPRGVGEIPRRPSYVALVVLVGVLSLVIPVALFFVLRRDDAAPPDNRAAAEPVPDIVKPDDSPPRARAPKPVSSASASASASASTAPSSAPPPPRRRGR